MVRGALSGLSAYAALAVTLGQGLEVAARVSDGGLGSEEEFHGQVSGNTGLAAASAFMRSPNGSNGNDLTKPIWLRLEQRLNRWTAFSSWDGVSWQQAGEPVGLDAAGVWVGLFVTPGGPAGARLRAVFDHVSFVPERFVQVGG